MYSGPNPFRFGDLALDEAFTDRAANIAELVADMRNGQNVVLYAPRRYGKTSLVWRAANEAVAESISVAYCDLMKTPDEGAFRGRPREDDLRRSRVADRRCARTRRKASSAGCASFLQISLDPKNGSLSFTFTAQQRRDIDETIERLLELPQRIAGENRRRVVLILDEFQEVVKLDQGYPNLMRSIFQTQPEVSPHLSREPSAHP